jgi:arginine decarboxylase
LYIPTKIFFTKGVGVHKEYLASFELALRSAGIEKFNIVTVSSIYPVGCKKITRKEGLKQLKPGQIVHAVLAKNSTNESNRLIAASLGVAIPTDKKMYGYLSEHHPFGETDEYAGEYAEDLAASMLATTLGIDFDPDKAWNEKLQVFKMSGRIVKTFNVTQSARGNKNGMWTTVVAASILLP